jgi:hypothetical protein
MQLRQHVPALAHGEGGDEQAHQHPGDGGVHAAVVQRVPERHAQQQVHHAVAHVVAVAQEERHGERSGAQQPVPMEPRAIEDGDDEDAAQVVEDGQRGEEHHQRVAHAILDQGEAADGEGDVRGHGDGPPAQRRGARVERHVDARRHHHASQRRDGRQHGPRHRPQLAHGQLALDFHAHQEEEERHQPIVDEFTEGEVGGAASQPQRQGGRRRGPCRPRPGGELAHTMARTAHRASRMPLLASSRKKAWSGATAILNNWGTAMGGGSPWAARKMPAWTLSGQGFWRGVSDPGSSEGRSRSGQLTGEVTLQVDPRAGACKRRGWA